MNGEIGLDEYLAYYELHQKFFIPAHQGCTVGQNLFVCPTESRAEAILSEPSRIVRKSECLNVHPLAHYDPSALVRNRLEAAEIIVPWLYVMGACIFILFAFITALLLDCLK